MSSKVTYRQQYTRCGKQRCRKCREGSGHGPYWYAYWSEKGRTVSKYIGIRLPEHIKAMRQSIGEKEKETHHNLSVQQAATSLLRIYLLGQFRIERSLNGEWQTIDSRTWHRRRARALLGCLLGSPGRRLGREQVMELLWPDLDIDIAANRLNGAVHELRQILEPEIARPAASRLLRLERDILELADSTQIWVDAEAFENLLKEAHTCADITRSEHLLEEAAQLYRGSYLLEELYSEWAAPRRDALQRAWVGLLLSLADLQIAQEAYNSAIETLDRLHTADPTNETALQRLMVLLTQQDRRSEALHMYPQHLIMLKRDYEGEPLPETTALYEELRQGHIPALSLSRKTRPLEDANTPVMELAAQQRSPQKENAFPRSAFQVGRHNQSPLIGRNQELDAMRQILFTLEHGTGNEAWRSSPNTLKQVAYPHTHTGRVSPGAKQPHFILLKGESGIGKTRLAEELSLDAYMHGWAIAWSRSYEQEGTIPYKPWIELLRALLQETSTITELLSMTTSADEAESTSSLPFKLERLAALLPELTRYTATPPGKAPPPVLRGQERLHLWEATLGLLHMLSKFHPLLLVLDDLHWADDSSIELLTYLIHHLPDQRVLFIGTCRDIELAPQQKLRMLITDLQREQAITTMSVQPLTHTQIKSLLAHLPQGIVERIQTQAAGNPFFAEELARYVGGTASNEEQFLLALETNQQAEGASPLRPLLVSTTQKGERESSLPEMALPETITAVLERRLSRLSSDSQILLGKAAVLGGSFELSQLLPLANEYDEDTVLDLLEETLHAGLLTEEETGAHITYHFWHPLIINHLYARLSAARRSQLHRRAAEAIKASTPFVQQEKAAAIVYHLSRGSGSPQDVAYYAEMAGNQAYSLAAYSEAQRYYLQVLQALAGSELPLAEGHNVHTQIEHITPQVITQLARDDPMPICRLLEHIAECSVVMGNFKEVRYLYQCILDLRTSEHFQQHIAVSEQESTQAQQQEAQIQALLWREIGTTWSNTGEYERAYECYGRGKEVMLQAGVSSGAAWACLHIGYGDMLRLEGNYQEAQRYLEDALEMLACVVQQAAPSMLAEDVPSTSPKELQTRTERALLGDPLDIGYAHERLGIVAASVGHMSEALKHMHTTLNLYEQSDLISGMARVCGNLGAVYIIRGEHDAARKYLHRSLDLAEREGNLPDMAFVMGNLGDVAHRSGALLEAEDWLKQSLVLGERINDREHQSWCHTDLASVQQDLGKVQEAKASIQYAISIGRAIKSPRCIRYALVKLGDIRIIEASLADLGHSIEIFTDTNIPSSRQRRHLLLRAKASLQRAILLNGMEIDNLLEGKYLLATAHFWLDELETAQHMAVQILKEAQEQEALRNVGRAYRLLGSIMAARKQYQQADDYFEQAIDIFRGRELHLDGAQTLYPYGVMLLQWSNSYATSSRSSALQRKERTTKETTYQRGIASLSEARNFFTACQAVIDLSLVERVLVQIETQIADVR